MNSLAKESRWTARATNAHSRARKPQPEDEFHKVVPGLSTSSHIFKRTVAAVLDKPGGLLSPWCMKSSKRPRILKVRVTQTNLTVHD